MRIIDHVLTDRGSRYAAAGGPARSLAEARALVSELRRRRKFARATHHSWALICEDGAFRDDDGESGAGALILRALEGAGLRDHVVIVTRWYGGKPLGGDRFRHVLGATRVYLAALAAEG